MKEKIKGLLVHFFREGTKNEYKYALDNAVRDLMELYEEKPVIPTYSKDYKKLFKTITSNEGLQILCLVNYEAGTVEPQTFRDPAAVRFLHGNYSFSARGRSYLSYDIKSESDFVRCCELLNLEY